MTAMDLAPLVYPLCLEFGVRRLELFGSTARREAVPDSDVDLLVEFKNPQDQPARRFFGLKHRLEEQLGQPVDLLTANSLRNPFFRARVDREKVPLYDG